jgi:Flp pilus assembly protein TadB
MNKFIVAMLAALAFAVPFSGIAAPDETQKQIIQRTQEAKKKLASAQAAHGAERHKMMQDHMKLMQETMAHMQKAKPGGGMTPDQMREWMDEHMKLMQQLMGQMMDEHHMMMQGMPGMGQGMGMQGGGKK